MKCILVYLDLTYAFAACGRCQVVKHGEISRVLSRDRVRAGPRV